MSECYCTMRGQCKPCQELNARLAAEAAEQETQKAEDT